jgi:nucleoside-diphosphate-sugar epimerase
MLPEALSRPRRALVTGATGFVGSHLVRTLVREGWVVHILVRPTSDLSALGPERDRVNVHRHDGSIQVLTTALDDSAPDVVFHLASLFISEHKPDHVKPLISANILFPTLLLEAMAMTQVRCLVNTGTAWQHYRDAPYSPVCLYAATKQAFEAVLQYYVETHKFRAITLKLFDTYGPEDHRPKLFSLLAKAAGATEPLAMSAGDQHLNLVYIDDVVAAYLSAAKRVVDASHDGHEIYAVSSNATVPLRDVVSVYERVTRTRLNIAWGAMPYRQREPMRPWSGGIALPGWSPRVSLSEGIARLAES